MLSEIKNAATESKIIKREPPVNECKSAMSKGPTAKQSIQDYWDRRSLFVAVDILCRPCFMAIASQGERTKRLMLRRRQCREADGEHVHAPTKRPSSSTEMQSGAHHVAASSARDEQSSNGRSGKNITPGVQNATSLRATMAEKYQRQRAEEMLCLFARCPPKINCSGGTCHGRSAARFRSTVEKPRTFVIPFCVLALWTFGGIAERITSKVGSQRYSFVMIDAEPTLRCVIFIRMMDLCRQLCLPGRPFLELQDLLVLAATCVSAQSISAPHDMTAQRLASNQMPKFGSCVESWSPHNQEHAFAAVDEGELSRYGRRTRENTRGTGTAVKQNALPLSIDCKTGPVQHTATHVDVLRRTATQTAEMVSFPR